MRNLLSPSVGFTAQSLQAPAVNPGRSSVRSDPPSTQQYESSAQSTTANPSSTVWTVMFSGRTLTSVRFTVVHHQTNKYASAGDEIMFRSSTLTMIAATRAAEPEAAGSGQSMMPRQLTCNGLTLTEGHSTVVGGMTVVSPASGNKIVVGRRKPSLVMDVADSSMGAINAERLVSTSAQCSSVAVGGVPIAAATEALVKLNVASSAILRIYISLFVARTLSPRVHRTIFIIKSG